MAMAVADHDIAIIGGGIHGVGVAQAAAAAGYRAILLEQKALASGTSSRSSKLIHGGLRYLESGQLNLVRESLSERNLLLRLAPELVHAIPFYIPVYRHSRRRPWMIHLGLLLYSWLAGRGELARFSRLAKNQWSQLDGLLTHDLQAVFRYWDAQTDDAALTEAVMRSAQVLGAKLQCPTEVLGASRTASGYVLTCRSEDRTWETSCRYLVNASGPWANSVLQRVTPAVDALDVDLVQGTHIVVAGSLHDRIFYLEAPSDGRAVFVMPWKDDTSLVGTTEHFFEGDPSQVQPLQQEVEYLLATLRHYFPRFSDRVLDQYAGLRVLPKTKRSAFHRPRETILHSDDAHPRLLTIYGGKLTAYRSTASRVIDKIAPALGPRKQKIATDKIALTRSGNSN